METMTDILNLYTNEIMIGLILFSLFLFLLFLIQEYRVSYIKKKYNKIFEGSEGKSIEKMLLKHLDEVNSVKEQVEYMEKYTSELKQKLKNTIQKIGMIRYNAFDDISSDLSFSLALLDENDTGVVISSLYSRNESITYGKPVINGESDYKLSIEEIQAIDRAKRNSLYMEEKMRRTTR